VPTAQNVFIVAIFLKVYFLPELLGGVIVSEVFSQMGEKN
jgi:hypothetical protein